MNKRDYIDDVNRALLSNEKYTRYVYAVNMNVDAIAYVLGITRDQVRIIMQGYPKDKIGNSVLYTKENVYKAMKERQELTA